MPHTPGTHGTGHRAAARTGREPRPGTTGRVSVLILVTPLIGMFLGEAVFTTACTAAAALAALRVRPAGLWWVLPAAPLAVWAVCVGRELFDASGDATKQAVAVAQGMITAFPAMALTLLAATAVALLRRARRRRYARV